MGQLATFSLNQVLFNITTSTTILGSPTFVGGSAYACFEVRGITANGGQATNNNILIQGTLGVAAVGSPTWVPLSVTNVTNDVVQGAINADGIYAVMTAKGSTTPYLMYMAPMITSLSNVTGGRLDVWCLRQTQVSG